jgi:hypothetical protein
LVSERGYLRLLTSDFEYFVLYLQLEHLFGFRQCFLFIASRRILDIAAAGTKHTSLQFFSNVSPPPPLD